MFHGIQKILHETLQNYINTSNNNNNNNKTNNNNNNKTNNNNNNKNNNNNNNDDDDDDDDNYNDDNNNNINNNNDDDNKIIIIIIIIIIILIYLNFFPRHQQRWMMKCCNQVRRKRCVPEMWTCHRWRGRRPVVTIYLPPGRNTLSWASLRGLTLLNCFEKIILFLLFFQGNLTWILKVDEFRIDWILEGK